MVSTSLKITFPAKFCVQVKKVFPLLDRLKVEKDKRAHLLLLLLLLPV